jgi:hypothetical protein
MKRPIHKERFNRWRDRIRDPESGISNIPALFAHECWWCIRSYYGSSPRALWFLLREDFWIWSRSIWHRFLIVITDRVGWTKIYHYPQTDTMVEHWQRHGYKCHGSPNCENMDCIEDSIPRWFKIIFRWPL